ncbi:MAG TPA: hypothetical protein VFY84_01780 [Jiangellales bacterium]|nr:hypothetical protein [Jiangellales bacterium]
MAVRFAIRAASDAGQVTLDGLVAALRKAAAGQNIQVHLNDPHTALIVGPGEPEVVGLADAIARWLTSEAPDARLTFRGPGLETTTNFIVPELLLEDIRDSIAIVVNPEPTGRTRAVAEGIRRLVQPLLPRRRRKRADVQLQVVGIRGALADLQVLQTGESLVYPAADLAELAGLPPAELSGAVFRAGSVVDRHGTTYESIRLDPHHQG